MLTSRIRAAGARTDSSCGIHVHVGLGGHTPQSLRRLVNIVNAKEDLLTQALGIVDPGDVYPDITQGLIALDALSDYTLTSASVTGIVECARESTNPDMYSVEFHDGDSYSLVCDGGTITLN